VLQTITTDDRQTDCTKDNLTIGQKLFFNFWKHEKVKSDKGSV